jgi:hypothetical protein
MGSTKTVSAEAVLDEAIRKVYLVLAQRHDVGADKLVTDSQLSAEFIRDVQRALPVNQKADADTIRWRTLTLRKRGEDKGGLPKTQRAFHGRDAKGQKPKPR